MAVDARIILEPSTVPAPRHLIIAPYPNQYESDWLLEDGTPVLLRPMKPEDESLVSEFLSNCSEDTVYFRYFKLIKKWTHEMLIRFTQNDYDRELGLMAIGLPPGPEVMMGVSRMVMAADRSTAEFAVIVADPWQGKGLGEKLIERVIEIARDNGVKMLYGDVLATNLPMLEMVKRLGFVLQERCRGRDLPGAKRGLNHGKGHPGDRHRGVHRLRQLRGGLSRRVPPQRSLRGIPKSSTPRGPRKTRSSWPSTSVRPSASAGRRRPTEAQTPSPVAALNNIVADPVYQPGRKAVPQVG